jgi:membrane protein implicated in regulation of membrane protease activity
MSVVFAVAFLLGLVLAVHAMLHGVERPVSPVPVAPHELRVAHDPRSEPSPVLNAQTVAAFLGAFGATGYTLHRLTTVGNAATLALAIGAGVATAALSVWLLAGWALPSAREDVEDERYLMQGHPAAVTRAIPAGGEGEIAYEADGRQWSVRARSWDDAAIEAGTEVAIERVEGGIAFVERWAMVEARL